MNQFSFPTGAPVKRQDRLPAVLCGMGKSTDEDPNNLTTDAVLLEIQAVVRVLLMTAQILRRNQDMVLQAANVLEFIMTYTPELFSSICRVLVPSDRPCQLNNPPPSCIFFHKYS